MNSESFCYWLQGFIELHGKCPDESQWEMIKEHLQLVFDKKTKTKEEVKTWFDKIGNKEQWPTVTPTYPSYPKIEPYKFGEDPYRVTCSSGTDLTTPSFVQHAKC